MKIHLSASLSYKNGQGNPMMHGSEMLRQITDATDAILTAHGYKPNRLDPDDRQVDDAMYVEVQYP